MTQAQFKPSLKNNQALNVDQCHGPEKPSASFSASGHRRKKPNVCSAFRISPIGKAQKRSHKYRSAYYLFTPPSDSHNQLNFDDFFIAKAIRARAKNIKKNNTENTGGITD